MRRETEFQQRYCQKLQEKVPCVRGETKLNFGNEIIEILVISVLPRLSMKCPKCMLGGVPKMEANCGNDIAENEKKKKRIVATKLPKIEKKKMLRPQHFSQQIIGG